MPEADDVAEFGEEPITAIDAALAKLAVASMAVDNDDDSEDDFVVQLQEAILDFSSQNLKQGDHQMHEDDDHQAVKRPPQSPRRRRRSKRPKGPKASSQSEAPPEEQQQQQPWLKVLEIFPDAQVEHVQNLLMLNSENVEVVLGLLVEQGYPKDESLQRDVVVERPKSQLPSTTASSTIAKLDFYSASSFTPSSAYKYEVVHCILAAFPRLTSGQAKAHLLNANWHYAICHDRVCKSIVGEPTGKNTKKRTEKVTKEFQEAEEERQYFGLKIAETERRYACLKKVWTGPAVHAKQNTAFQWKKFVPFKRQDTGALPPPKPVTITDPMLKKEVAYVEQQMSMWKEKIERRLSLRQAREVCKQNGTAVLCNCCFDEFAMEEMIACREQGHLFCTDCVTSYAEHQIFGAGSFGIDRQTKQPAVELLCMHGDGCSSGFQVAPLRKAMPDTVMAKYDELQCQNAVECSNMDDLCTCPKCGFQAALAKSEMIFRCPVSDCRFESCRRCREEAHIPLRCEEVKVVTNGRVTVEEAISKAKIRTCPKCGKSFIKSDGCNKVTCACGILICYVCRQRVYSYDHFCQTPHCSHASCNKCSLHSNVAEDDMRAMREAGLKAAEEVRKVSYQQQRNQVNVDVEQLLRDPVKKLSSGRIRL